MAITNQPITIRDVSIVAGVSDLDCPLITVDLKRVRHKETPRKIPLYKRATWDTLAVQLSNDNDTVTTNRKNLKANELWEERKLIGTYHTNSASQKTTYLGLHPRLRRLLKTG